MKRILLSLLFILSITIVNAQSRPYQEEERHDVPKVNQTGKKITFDLKACIGDTVWVLNKTSRKIRQEIVINFEVSIYNGKAKYNYYSTKPMDKHENGLYMYHYDEIFYTKRELLDKMIE